MPRGSELKSRRVLWVVSSLAAGGAERIVVEFANGFADHGHDVAVLTLSSPQHDHYLIGRHVTRIALDQPWRTTSLWQRLTGNLRLCYSIRRAILAYRPDVVISFIDQSNVRVLAALTGTGIPVIISERIDPRRHILGRFWNLARRVLYPIADRIVVQTQGIADWAGSTVHLKRIRIIENPVRDLPPPQATDRREPKSILAVGRLHPQKGFDLLLRGFASSGLARNGVQLIILGDGPEREALETLVRDLKLDHAVSMPGLVSDPETWMARATVFVLPSRYEGFPNALLEAMSMGCPSIATDCDTGPRDIIRHAVNGLLIPVDHQQALADALVLMLGDSNLRARLSAEALKVRDTYSKARILLEWENVIEEVL